MSRMIITVVAMLMCSAGLGRLPTGAKTFATAKLEPRSGTHASGTVELAFSDGSLFVKTFVRHVSPGEHGIHVHEKGDCSASDASSAGEHFNPMGEKHGGLHTAERHVGDFGNIEVPSNGTVTAEIAVPAPKTEFNWNDLVGKSIVLHEKQDDLVTQPSGDSGKRIACGVIQQVTKSAAE